MKVGRIGCMTALIMNEKRVFLTKHSPHRDLLEEFPYLGLPNDWRLDADF